MEGVSPVNTDRIPYACRLRLSGLLASRTYRFLNQMVVSSDAATSGGSGNCIFVTPSGDFVRTTGASLATVGNYGTLTTDATGTYEGWFISESTGNARFLPGKYVFMRISLNDGGSGTTVVTRFTTSDSIRVLQLSPAPFDSTGTGLRGTSFAREKDFVFTYDNTAGTGRPISGSFIERDGTNNSVSNSYSAFYGNAVDDFRGSFGMVLPNLLPTGVLRVERRALATGAVVTSATDADGLWPSGALTVNPVGGTTPIVLSGADVNYLTIGLAIAPSSLSFGDVVVNTSKTDSVLIKNTTAVSMTISSIVSSDTSAFAVTSASSVTLPAGGSAQVRLVFHPRFLAPRAGRITFTSNSPSSPDTLHLEGDGVALATSVIVPRFMEGISGINSDRIPFACRLRLSGLVASTTYRFFNQMVNSSDATSSSGSGNCIFSSPTGDFVRTTSADLATLGDYGTFTTDATGAYTGWFITESTGNARFLPGKFVFMRISLNDGGLGTTVATRVTTTDSVRVVKLNPAATDSTGTGLRGSSFSREKDFVFTYDNTAGTGRPISGSFIESDGTSNSITELYSAFYSNSVDGRLGAYGMVLPNLLPTGVRRVERRSLAAGAIVASATDADGLWPSGAQTVNPAGGTTAKVLTSADVNHLTVGLAIAPSSLSYGDVVVSATKTDSVLIKNTTAISMIISNIASSDTSAFDITSATSVTLAAGASTQVRIVFHPRFPAPREGRITFTSNGPTSPDTLHVSGNGVGLATSVIVPRYMEGISGINNDRIPFACRLRLSKLVANTTYRYSNQVVISSDPATSDGAGNPIFVTPSGDFVRTTSASLATLGDYGTFTTDATGTYEGWFITESTGNDRFLPGKFVFMRIGLNDGGAGTTVATRITASDSVRVVKLSPGATDSTGTGLRGTTFASAKDFVFTYDNTAGTGRPISGSFVESDGTSNSISNAYSAFYANNVEGFPGAYGMVLPNLLPTGVRRVERRSLASGAVVTSTTDPDGLWPSGAQTVNPNGGTTAVVLSGADVNYLTVGLAIAPASLTFGNVVVPASKTDSVLVKNTTAVSMTISSIVSSDTSAFEVTTSTPVTLAAGASTQVRLVFHPRFPAPREGKITFTSNGPTSPDTLHVEGTGIGLATSIIVPRYMEGASGINNDRIPFACRLRLSGLLANTTYRHFNQMVVSSDVAASAGAGNPIFATPSGDFVRTTSASLSTLGNYGTFTTDATGAYTGWFITESTGNDRFLPGKFVFMRISLNDGGAGTSVVSRITTSDSVRVVKLSPGATDSTGTGLRGASSASAKDFIFTYDNTAGTGRPISGSFVESDGTTNSVSNSYAAFYANSVDGFSGAYGMVLPNLLPTGVRRVERRSLASGAVVTSATDLDGLWPSGAQTVNPNGGTTAVALTSPDVTYLTVGLALAPASMSFGDVVVGVSKTDSVLAVNTTGASLIISSIVSSDTSAFAVTTTTPLILPVGGSAQVKFVFHPRYPASRAARITFTSNAPTSPDTLHVEGNGLALATSVLVPRFIEGVSGINSDRIPYACRLRLTKLLANTTYRYSNQMVISSDAGTSNGAGNPIFATPSGNFVRTVTVDFDSAGHYGTFTTDATGAYEGWFITEPTGSGRFLSGKFVFMRIALNDGGAGTTVATRVTTTDSVRVVKLSPPSSDSTGTALRGTTSASAKDFIFTYDNTAGTGRPISGSFIESDGTANSASEFYSAFYANSVDGLLGAYGVVLPNQLPTGIRRVERRSLANGTIVTSATDPDGLWPSGAQTVNPSGGPTAVVLSGADVNYLTVGLALASTSWSFANVVVPASRTDSVLVKNTTAGSLTISSIVSSDTSAFAVSTTTPVTLAAGASTQVKFVFHPRFPGLKAGRITFTSNAPTSPDTLHVEGNGLALATSVIVPRFMEGLSGVNSDRIPYACRLRLSGLLASRTYRHFNQMVVSSDAATSNGAGNPIFASPSGSFVRTVSVDFDSAGHYGTFTTDPTGTYEGWFITEPTGSGRFVPGKFVFMRIALNDGGTGTTVATRVTASDSVRVVMLSPTATDSTGTGLRGTTFARERDFVFTYDNTAGTGRPISGSFIESDGTANSASNLYSAFYASNVDGFPRAYGMVLPNLLPNGIRRVERRSLASGTVVASATDADGLWPSGAQTVNPIGGPTAVVLSSTDVNYLTVGLALATSTLSFGDVFVSATKTDSVLIKNTTGSSMTISSIASTDTSAFVVTSATSLTLAAGASSQVRIAFHPRIPDQRTGRITFTSSAATSPDTLHVNGNGIPFATALIVPRFMEGISGINSDRIPFACRLRLTGLLASTTYRYFNQMVVSSDATTAGGAGNPIFAPLFGSFVRTATVDFDTTGHYGTFNTDPSGIYEGWFITESTGNARFLPGKFVFMRISLNDGGTGTSVMTRITTSDSVRVVKLVPGATDSTGTGLRGTTFAASRDFIVTYDNTAGTGRPISGSFVESDGTTNSVANSYAAFYANNVDGFPGAFGMIMPNLLPNGIRRVERRSLATGAIVAAATDGNGSWPSGAQTVNPNGGPTAVALSVTDVGYLSTGLVLAPSPKLFGKVAVSTSKTDSVLVTNSAGQAVTINSIVSSDTSAFAVNTTTPVTLAAGASTQVQLVFHPRVAGLRGRRITFTNTGPTSPDTVHVEGTGIVPSFTLTPSALSFGAVTPAQSRLDSMKVRNLGVDTLVIASIVSNNEPEFELLNTGPANVRPGDSLTIRVTFHPTSLGQKDGRITFAHNGASSPDTIHVSGIGLQLTSRLPRYIAGDSATGANRVPFAYRARLEGLLRSRTYRYFNQVVTSKDSASSNGAGNCIFTTPSGNFVRSTTPGLGAAGHYGTLTTDTTGVYEGWFVTESNANARFAPAGFVFMRICLNDGGAGTAVVSRITTTDSVRVVKLGPASDDSSGTGLRAAGGVARQFVFVYDDSAGTGRPVSGSFIESDGTANTAENGYASFYADNVEAVAGAFGIVVPNALPNGIRRIEQRSLVGNGLIGLAMDGDGAWPSGAGTVNPVGGPTAIVLTASDLNHVTGVEPGPNAVRRFMLSQNGPNPFYPTTTFRFSVAEGGLATVVIYDVLGNVVATPFRGQVTPGQEYAVKLDGRKLRPGVYWYRLKCGNRIATKKMVLLH